MLANPAQFGQAPPDVKRVPLCAEHTDDILRELGRNEDEIMRLRVGSITT